MHGLRHEIVQSRGATGNTVRNVAQDRWREDRSKVLLVQQDWLLLVVRGRAGRIATRKRISLRR